MYKRQRHGGANLRVVKQFEEMKENIHNWKDETEVGNYLRKILNKEAGDGSGPVSYTHLIVVNNFYHINSIGKCRKSQGDTQILLAKKQGNSRGGCSIWIICQLCYVKRTS